MPNLIAYNPASFTRVPKYTTIKYGLLYNWWVTQGALIPVDMVAAGWDVTLHTDFSTLATYLGGTSVAGGKVKEIGTLYWKSGGTNDVGFNGRGAGGRSGADGTWGNSFVTANAFLKNQAIWVNKAQNSSTSITYGNVSSVNNNIIPKQGEGSIIYKASGCSIRLVRLAVEGDPAADGSACTPYVGNDGKVYRTVRIGTQVWLADNLAETKWNDGITYIQGWNAGGHVVISNADWAALGTAAVCVYDNDESNM